VCLKVGTGRASSCNPQGGSYELAEVVSQEEWTAARCTMLEKEKDVTRQRDRLNTERREQPMVEVTKPCEPVRRDH